MNLRRQQNQQNLRMIKQVRKEINLGKLPIKPKKVVRIKPRLRIIGYDTISGDPIHGTPHKNKVSTKKTLYLKNTHILFLLCYEPKMSKKRLRKIDREIFKINLHNGKKYLRDGMNCKEYHKSQLKKSA